MIHQREPQGIPEARKGHTMLNRQSYSFKVLADSLDSSWAAPTPEQIAEGAHYVVATYPKHDVVVDLSGGSITYITADGTFPEYAYTSLRSDFRYDVPSFER